MKHPMKRSMVLAIPRLISGHKLFLAAAAVLFLALSTASARADGEHFTLNTTIDLASDSSTSSVDTLSGPNLTSASFTRVVPDDNVIGGGYQFTRMVILTGPGGDVAAVMQGIVSAVDEFGNSFVSGTLTPADGAAVGASGSFGGYVDPLTNLAHVTLDADPVVPEL